MPLCRTDNQLITRRSLIGGLAALITAPAIVKAGSLMPVRTVLWTPRNPRGLIRVGNPDDPSQYVEVELLGSIKLTLEEYKPEHLAAFAMFDDDWGGVRL